MKRLIVISFLFFFTSYLFPQNFFFYSFEDDPYTFVRRNSDGTIPTTIYTPATGTVASSAADGSINKLYFYDNSVSGSKVIFKSNYDGTGRASFLTVSTNVSLAAGNGYLYYAYSSSPYSIRRINSDGTGDTQIYLNPTDGMIYDIAVDIANSYLYFYEYGYDGTNNRIARTDLDGNNLTTVFTTTVQIHCIAAGNNYFYFAPSTSPWTFRRRNSDGTNETVIYTPPSGEVYQCNYNEDLDKIYFYDNSPKAIYISDNDGSNRSTLYSGFSQRVASLSSPKGNIPLPVELNSFTAASTCSAAGEAKVVLNWQTATEVNNYGFDIERQNSVSSSQKSEQKWEKIGFVEGAGNSNSPKEYSYSDESNQSGIVQYRLKQIDSDGQFKYSETVEVNVSALPSKFELLQNYPNPFNPSTAIRYSLPVRQAGVPSVDAQSSAEADAPSLVEGVHVSLKVYDILGNEVVTLVNENQAAGNYEVEFNGSNLASGIYIYKLSSGNFTASKKLILMK